MTCGERNATIHSSETVHAQRLASHESVGYLSSVTRTKIKAFSSHLKDYPDGMSLWEKESVVAGAFLSPQKKARKTSKHMTAPKRKRSQV
jgi:hypothetical protein